MQKTKMLVIKSNEMWYNCLIDDYISTETKDRGCSWFIRNQSVVSYNNNELMSEITL